MVSVNEQLQEYDRMINGSSDNISENAIIKTLIEQGIKEFPAFLSILKKEHFSINNNAIIYTKMCEMFENNEDWSFVEIVTNIEYAGVKKHLIDVFTNPLYFANLDISLRSAYKIIEKNRLEFQKKRLETFSKELNKENVDTALSEIFDLLSNKDQQKKDNINEIIPTYIENIFNPKPKVTTKFNKLNEFNGGGWKKGNIHTFAGRPGQGKTAMLVSMVNYDLSLNRKVGILSLEMSTDQIITNLISNKTKIDNQRIDNYVVEAQKSENFRITVSSAINDLQMSNL